jgi:hypothetical protein
LQWFSVDTAGLAKLQARRGKQFIIFELVQNAWDQNVTRVEITLTKQPGARDALLRVEDDDPEGFSNLTHSFTLFANSDKKSNVQQRGRFNLGEKLVIAMCRKAEILTTTGGVKFDETGRHTLHRKRERGSVFEGQIKLTNDELEECRDAVIKLIPPDGIITTFNGAPLPARQPLTIFTAPLLTEISDEEGNLKRTTRRTDVHVFELREGEVGWLYELGIPVVETGDDYHCDVQQKVPLNFDRDNVTPSYLKTLRVQMLNALHDRLDPDKANASWVRDALNDPNVSDEAVHSAVKHRFGAKAVIYDPSDPEANHIAASEGYTVVTGGQMSKPEWKNVRRVGALKPAGQVTPSPKPFSDDPNAKPLKIIPPDDWSCSERRWVACAKKLAIAMIGVEIEVKIADDCGWSFDGAYGNRVLTVNKAHFGAEFFSEMSEEGISFLIHEFGHHYEGNHLDATYHKALSSLGARATLAVSRDPSLLSLK